MIWWNPFTWAKWAQYIGLAVLAAAAVGTFMAYERHVGGEKMQRKMGDQITRDSAGSVAQASEKRDATVGAATAAIQQNNLDIAAKDATISVLSAAIRELKNAHASALASANATPEAELDPRINAQFGLPATAPLPKREILAMAIEYPKLQDAVSKQDTRQTEMEGKVKKLEDNFNREVEIANSEREFGDDVFTEYIRIYNARGMKKRSLKCLRIWHCAADRMEMKDPSTFKRR